MAQKLESQRENLRTWSRRIKISVFLLFLFSSLFMNGFFSGDSNGVILDRTLMSEMVSWTNFSTVLRECWFAIVALIVYLILREYNNRLDLEEQQIVEA
jgi:hypothetical protein